MAAYCQNQQTEAVASRPTFKHDFSYNEVTLYILSVWVKLQFLCGEYIISDVAFKWDVLLGVCHHSHQMQHNNKL